jgi:diguanylate cyclase (GGDEF)-like protein
MTRRNSKGVAMLVAPKPIANEGFLNTLDKGFKRLEPVDWVFGLFRAASIAIIVAWILWHPILDPYNRLVLAILATYFAIYSMLLSLGGILRPGKIRVLYHVAMVFDIVFIGLVILATGGIHNSLFFLGFYLLIPLLTFYFGTRSGGYAYLLCIAAYLIPNWKELPNVQVLDMFLKIGVLGGIYASSGFLKLRQEFARERLYKLNVEVERKNRLLAHKQVEERNKFYELMALHKVNQVISSAVDTKELYSRILSSVTRELHFQHFCLWLYDEEKNQLVAKAVEGIPTEVIDGVTVDNSNPVEGSCLSDKTGTLFEDLSRFSDYDYIHGYLPSISSAMCAPIIVRGRLAGVISVYSKHTESFNKERLDVLVAVAEQISIGLDKSQVYDQMRFLSMQDGLTHIFNRRFFDEQIEYECVKAAEIEIAFALLLIDIDFFKKVNDELGHLTGDEVLRRVSQVLMSNTRQSDYVCRYGGEEFAVIIHNMDSKTALNRAERLRKAVENDVNARNADGSKRVITISVGVAVYAEGATPQELIDMADQGLYIAKDSGRNCVRSIMQE